MNFDDGRLETEFVPVRDNVHAAVAGCLRDAGKRAALSVASAVCEAALSHQAHSTARMKIMRFMTGLLGRPPGNVGQPSVRPKRQSNRPGIRAEHRSRQMNPNETLGPVGIPYDLIGPTKHLYGLGLNLAHM